MFKKLYCHSEDFSFLKETESFNDFYRGILRILLAYSYLKFFKSWNSLAYLTRLGISNENDHANYNSRFFGRIFKKKPQNDKVITRFKYLVLTIILFLFISCTSSLQKSDQSRYIITSPEIAEIFTLIQGTENIVGITTECDFSPELKSIPKVGTFGKVDFEKIIELNPTIVFTSALEQDALSDELQKLNIKTIKVYPKSIDEMLKVIREIGNILNNEKRANFITDSLQTELANLADSTNLTISTKSPKVYIEIYGNPIMSVSDKSFVGEVVQTSGGNNIFSELPRDYSRIKPEEVIEANPEIIILTYPGIDAAQIKERKGWEVISACKNNRIYTVDDIDPDLILRASPRVIEGIKKMKKIFEGVN